MAQSPTSWRYDRQQSLLGRLSAAAEQAVFPQADYAAVFGWPGQHWLDVGCGTGETALAIAHMVGPTGSVVGIDIEPSQIERARQRAQEFFNEPSAELAGAAFPVGTSALAVAETAAGLNLKFLVGDAEHLPFPEATFDGCRADRVFQHLAARERVLSEMIRVCRPGAWICVSEPDWGTLAIDAPDRRLTRCATAHLCDQVRNGWCGRQLPRMFARAGLVDREIVAGTLVLGKLDLADELYGLRLAAERMKQSGAFTVAEAQAWLASLSDADAAGEFFCSLTGFSVIARKPSP
ncbi:MAG: methyltransferase domain-containing protein [Aureliella sp.]